MLWRTAQRLNVKDYVYKFQNYQYSIPNIRKYINSFWVGNGFEMESKYHRKIVLLDLQNVISIYNISNL